MAGLPSGTVTFLFTDIEGSTSRWERQPEAMGVALARHDALVRVAIHGHGGHVVKTMGDAFHAVFARAPDAVAAALDAQRRLQAEPWGEIGPIRVRMAVHTGAAEERDGDYYGPPLNRAARLMSAGHGGQVLLSQSTYELVRGTPPDGVTFVDLGEHRLKDLIHPERVFQLAGTGLPSNLPPLRSLNARSHNLPVQPTRLLGREQEVTEVRGLIQNGARLVTLTGPGGTGKTRLSLQVGAELVDQFDDGVFLVELAPLTDPSLVPSTIAQVLGVQDVSGRPVLDGLKEYLRSRSLLLVLDNFEQIVVAGPVVGDLLAASPGLSVLVTSREPLRIRGEREFAIPPLALPDAGESVPLEALSQYGAVALFLERAVAIRADFALTAENAAAVREICARLDGLPLAIELAAARVRLLTPQAMASRLERRLPLLMSGGRDLPSRQRTLRGAIDWSHELLDEAERHLFRRLSVFVGGWTLDAAESVCDTDGDLDVLGGLESLVSKSLVRQEEDAREEPRFGMLETLREYATEQLEVTHEQAVLRQQHAHFYMALAEQAEPELRGGDQVVWMEHLEREHDNARAALAWSLASGIDTETALRLAGALYRFWQVRHISEGYDWLSQVLDAATRTGVADDHADLQGVLAKALNGAGVLARDLGHLASARRHLEESLAIRRTLGDRWAVGQTLNNVAMTAILQQDYASAEPLAHESVLLWRELGDSWGLMRALGLLGRLLLARGQLAEATEAFDESLTLGRRLRDIQWVGSLLHQLGSLALTSGDYERARQLLQESASLEREQSDRYALARVLGDLGLATTRRGEREEAFALLRESIGLFQELGNAVGIGQSLQHLAELAAMGGHSQRAARLLGAADAVYGTTDIAGSIATTSSLENAEARVRAELGDEGFMAARAEGQAMSLNQAITYALDSPEPT